MKWIEGWLNGKYLSSHTKEALRTIKDEEVKRRNRKESN